MKVVDAFSTHPLPVSRTSCRPDGNGVETRWETGWESTRAANEHQEEMDFGYSVVAGNHMCSRILQREEIKRKLLLRLAPDAQGIFRPRSDRCSEMKPAHFG